MTTNTNVSVHLTPTIRIEQALEKAGIKDPGYITGLTITGTLTEDDFWFISDKMGKTLRELDFSNAEVEDKKITEFTFGLCTGLISITISYTVHSISFRAFLVCGNLTTITVHPDNPVYASENGLLLNRDKTVLIYCPSGVKGAFVIPEGVIQIEANTFYDSKRLISILIPKSVIDIGEEPFPNCTSLTCIATHPENPAFTSVNGVLFNKDKNELIRYPAMGQGYVTTPNGECYTVPNNVIKIRKGAFSLCTNLASIVIPDSVKIIGESAFYDCHGLTSIEIPKSVTEIGEDSFSYCKALTSIAVHPENSAYTSENGVLFNRDKTGLIRYPAGRRGDCLTGIYPAGRIGNGLTDIGDCYTVPNTVVKISKGAFSGCENLISVTIPNSVVTIEERAFESCISLTSLKLPDSVKEINDFAFYNCTGLTSMIIPDSVNKIDDFAFMDCKALTDVILPLSLVKINEALFGRTGLTSINVPDSVTEIGEMAFSDCTDLKSVTIPSSVIKINQYAFWGCTGLSSVNIRGEIVEGSPDDIEKVIDQYIAELDKINEQNVSKSNEIKS